MNDGKISGESLLLIFAQIIDERVRQQMLWGQQNHPSICTVVPYGDEEMGQTHRTRVLELTYGLDSEKDMRDAYEQASKRSRLTWGHILMEEVAEVIFAGDDDARRQELIQLAAVAIAWVECLDRRKDAAEL